MRETLLALLVVLLALAIAALWQGTDIFIAGVRSAMGQLVRFLPILVVAMLMAGFAEVLLPKQVVETWLSDNAGWRGIGLAWLAGILTPGGSVMGLPLVATLFKAGVGIGVLVTYMTALATLSVLRFPLEMGFVGWRLATLRVIVSLFLPPVAGLLAQVVAPVIVPR
ncbi:MAG: permease [Caldilineaceae bacterium]